MRLEANLMKSSHERVGVMRVPLEWGLPPEIVHVEKDGRQGLFVRQCGRPPIEQRSADLTSVEKRVYDYRQVAMGAAGWHMRDYWRTGQ